jgi:ABC-2 type transport system ATP-binding protein
MEPLLASVPALEIRGLIIRYGSVLAVDGLTLSVRPGEIYGLLGSNGAGKSSTIKSVVGLVKPTEGSLRVTGVDPAADALTVKSRIGYVPEAALLYDALTPREFLEFVASIRRMDPTVLARRTQEFADALQVGPDMDRPLATLSNGTRQKVMIMAAFLHLPPLLILDEPFNNLDPRSVRIMKDLLLGYVRDGRRAALFSTHTVEVAQQLCHRMGILDRGKLTGEGSLEELRARVGSPDATLEEVYLRLTSEHESVSRALRQLGEEA